MQKIFLQEAAKYGVLPMDDRVFERLDGAAVGRPDLMGGRTSITLSEGMVGMMEAVFPNVKNRSKTITAEIEVPASGGNGTILAQGGRFGGWSLYVKVGVPAYDYNFLGLQRFTVAGKEKLKPGSADLRLARDMVPPVALPFLPPVPVLAPSAQLEILGPIPPPQSSPSGWSTRQDPRWPVSEAETPRADISDCQAND